MYLNTWTATALALLTTFGAAMAALAPSARSAQVDDLSAFAGEWLYVEDRTEGRPTEEQQPPMSVTFGLRIEKDAVVMERARGREERIPLDGATIEAPATGSTRRSRGAWKDGVLEYEVDYLRESDNAVVGLIRREFRITPDGLLVRVVVGDPAQLDSVALYRHPQDIPLPAPAQATIADLTWLADAWVGTRRTASIEERWTPPLGGAMLGVSRTVKGGSMVAFEYLRIVERDGGLVYVAQPGGHPPTEFVLTELGTTSAVFENPRHDSPQRIVYELSAEGSLSASIGFAKGGRPQRFEFTREDN
ncbi:MAG: DUF6265 family protein [Planctomycetota bacterium]|nr:DUF6265 family protein [Planctomycetota bacterium]